MSAKLKIEKNVPLPTIKLHRAVEVPLEELNVGDSVLVPREMGAFGTVKQQCLSYMRLNKKIKLVYRKQKNTQDTRVWRIA